MRATPFRLAIIALIFQSIATSASTFFVDLNSANPTPPYSSWATAATNIQDAVDASSAGDQILVTNGVYQTGGRRLDGLLTNRVSLNKAVTLQSVNGPMVTVIRGAWDPISTNGPAAVRCVWMTNNSVLSGFTLSGGATREGFGTVGPSMFGGGVYATNFALVTNCIIGTNYASNMGGGAYSVGLFNCSIIGNHVVTGTLIAGDGAGANRCGLRNCFVAYNIGDQADGGGAYACNATNCAFVMNQAIHGAGIDLGKYFNCTIANNTSTANDSQAAAAEVATLTNCVVFGNFRSSGGSPSNYTGCTFSFSDSDPLPSGTGNIDVPPQLLFDNIHLASTSPCIGAGISSAVSGTDIDGQSWNNPPSIGCDEWSPEPFVFLPVFQAGTPSRCSLSFVSGPAAGQPPFTYTWNKDGAPISDNGHYVNSSTTNLIVDNLEPEDAGSYQLVVSNAFGVSTSQVATVVIHTVDAASASPVLPYTNWQNAASKIQDAINAASPGEIVLVTNGIYNTGGKVMSGDLTNRVALDKSLTAISVNGYAQTFIEGQWDAAATNGNGAVRCAWLANGALLNGFTLRNGATRGGNSITTNLQYGGGAWLSPNAVISNCTLTNNSARFAGGGVAFGTVNNSFLTQNTIQLNGGGAGAFQATLNNSTVIENSSPSAGTGAGLQSCLARNCIVRFNYYEPFGVPQTEVNYSGIGSSFLFSCTDPRPPGAGNIDTNVTFIDLGFHLPAVSPCRGAGSSLYASGTDMDDEAWASPPSMGCDEIIDANLAGPLTVAIRQLTADALVNDVYGLLGASTGRASSLSWSFDDGSSLTNAGPSTFHTWTNPGNYTVTFTAYNQDNPSGVSTNISVIVDPVNSPTLQSAGVVGNSFQFTFLAQTNALYTLQYATNLTPPVSWQLIRTFLSSTGGVLTALDPIGANTNRFYRLQAK